MVLQKRNKWPRRGPVALGCALLLLTFSCSSPGQAEDPGKSASAADVTNALPAPLPDTSILPPAPLQGMVPVAGGRFVFGADETQIDYYIKQSMLNFPGMVQALRRAFITPPRDIELSRFHISQFEVTNQEYRDFLLATGYEPREKADYLRHWVKARDYPDWAASFPVVWVSQADAEEYCRWRGGSLPTEEEWEKAARGTKGAYFPWGNVFPDADLANFSSNQAEPVGNRPGDRSPFEVYDMGGNVSELTSTVVQLQGETMVVVRGGNYVANAREMLAYRRDFTRPGQRSEFIGFRCVQRQ
jgi:formylglycine-generating enzyme required for sulfatase activity